MTEKTRTNLWPMARLGSIARVVGGSTPDSGNALYWGGDVVWLTPADLGKLKATHVHDSERHITPLGFRSASVEIVPIGSVVMSSRAPIGYLAINDVPLCTNQGCKSFIPGPSLDPGYLLYVLTRAVPTFRELGSGATFAEISKSKLEDYQIPLPPLVEQRRIAAKLDEQMATLVGAQAALAAQREAATALRSAVLRTALDPATHPAWPAVQLSQICTIVMGQSPPGDTYATSPVGLPFFQGKVDFGAFSPAARVWCVSPIKIAEKGDILLCVRAPVGPTNVANERCCIGRGLAALRPSTKLLPAFLLWWLKYVEPQISSLGEGSTFSAIGKSELQNLRIQLPALSEQRRIAEHLDSSIKEVDAVVASLDSQASTLDVLRTSLLDAAFSGQV